MSVNGKSRISLILLIAIFFCSENSFGQQKANDFTKRLGVFDGKMNSMNGRPSNFKQLSPSSARRISVEEWPAHFSSFGGKRFPMGNAKILGKERVSSTRIEIKTPLNEQIAEENFERATNQNFMRRGQAVNSVEFRDAYYARLNDRVDEWMNKVNNMSLRDINRYQFRKDRPSKPGFPVQRAGAGISENSRRDAPLKGSGLFKNKQIGLSAEKKNYWVGPKKIKSSIAPRSRSLGSRARAFSNSSKTEEPAKNFKTTPKPLLGPKTIRVQVGKPE